MKKISKGTAIALSSVLALGVIGGGGAAAAVAMDKDTVTITTDDVEGTHDRVSTTYEGLAGDVSVGDRLLVDDPQRAGVVPVELAHRPDPQPDAGHLDAEPEGTAHRR